MEIGGYMTVDEVAKYLGYEKQTIYNKVHKQEIPFHKIGRRAVRFKINEIDKWVQSLTQPDYKYVKIGNQAYRALQVKTAASGGYFKFFENQDRFLEHFKERISGFWKDEEEVVAIRPWKGIFTSEDLQIADQILNEGLVRPVIIINNEDVYDEEYVYVCLASYMTILKIFEGELTIESLRQLRKRIIENIQETIFFPEPEREMDQEESAAFIEFCTEYGIKEILVRLMWIIQYLEYGSAIERANKKHASHLRRYKDKETFWKFYFFGLTNFVINPFDEGPVRRFTLMDKSITQLSPEQIKVGLEIGLFSFEQIKEDIEKMTSALEHKSRALHQLIGDNTKVISSDQ